MNRIAEASLKGTLAAAQSENAYLKENYAQALERERVLLERLQKALAANERDRSALHKIVRQIDNEITGRMWLIEGRGCYEWNDDRYRQEFGWAVNALQAKLEPLRKIAGDLTDSPTTSEAVRAALVEQDPRLRFL